MELDATDNELAMARVNAQIAQIEAQLAGGAEPRWESLSPRLGRMRRRRSARLTCSVRAHTRVEEGDPAEVTVAVAAEEESHLIVMGSRGFGTLERIAFGSVSTHVTRHAHCPVLLAK